MNVPVLQLGFFGFVMTQTHIFVVLSKCLNVSSPVKVIEMCREYITSEGAKFKWNAGPPVEDGWLCTLKVGLRTIFLITSKKVMRGGFFF